MNESPCDRATALGGLRSRYHVSSYALLQNGDAWKREDIFRAFKTGVALSFKIIGKKENLAEYAVCRLGSVCGRTSEPCFVS